MFYFDGNQWVKNKYKITYQAVVYQDVPTGYPNASVESFTLTPELEARFEQVRYANLVDNVFLDYVMRGLGTPPDTRDPVDIMIGLVPPEKLTPEILSGVRKWEMGKTYKPGEFLTHDGILYKVLQPHKAQGDWTPDKAASLFAQVLTDPAGSIKEWVQPGSTNAYKKGDKVTFQGKSYESLIDNNVWSPSAYPAGWKELK